MNRQKIETERNGTEHNTLFDALLFRAVSERLNQRREEEEEINK